jgi:hypothetical protein
MPKGAGVSARRAPFFASQRSLPSGESKLRDQLFGGRAEALQQAPANPSDHRPAAQKQAGCEADLLGDRLEAALLALWRSPTSVANKRNGPDLNSRGHCAKMARHHRGDGERPSGCPLNNSADRYPLKDNNESPRLVHISDVIGTRHAARFCTEQGKPNKPTRSGGNPGRPLRESSRDQIQPLHPVR